jgi:hypothetical protein
MRKRAIQVGVVALAAAVLIAGLGACGAPDFTYVKNSGQKTYFKVPHEWHHIGTDSLDNVLGGTDADSAAADARRQLWWSVAYDASADPAPDHLITNDLTNQPIVYARISRLSESQQNAVSLNLLRNAFLPVTDDARAAAGPTGQPTGFTLVRDEVLAPSNGLHGVRVVYEYALAYGVLHTFDQTTLVNNDGSTLYLLVLRCSTACYRKRSSEFDTIARSFTVRSH